MSTSEIIFEKRPGKYDAMIVDRGRGLEEIACPKQAVIPHDMFHCAVEKVLHKRGFIHRYAEGEGVGFRMTPEAESEAVERLVETMQADSWSQWSSAPEEVIAMFKTTCEARGDQLFELTPDDIIKLREEIRALQNEWTAVPDYGRLTVILKA